MLPLLVVGSILMFALLAAGLPASPEHGTLPLFFNPDPRGIRQHASQALGALREGEDPSAAEQLARLGGAALPHVLPQLEGLEPDAQRRVARALAPVARRTGVARDEAVLEDPDASVRFWMRFWQDRSLDFQPTVVSRLVRRVAARSMALGGADLLQLDTYALPELVRQLGPIRTERDVTRARRLLRIAGDITERRWLVSANATPAEARRAVTECRRWWDENRHLYTDLVGVSRLTATLTQTRYGRWALRTLREITGLDASFVGQDLARRFRVTGPLLLSCMIGAWLVAALGAAAIAALPGRSGPVARVGSAVAITALVPAAVLWPPRLGLDGALGAACWVSLLLGTIPALHVGRGALAELAAHRGDRPGENAWRRVRRLALRSLGAAPVWAPLVFTEATTLVFALEWTTGLGGVGPRTVGALQKGDVPWLMAVSLTLGVLAALVQILADAALARTLRAAARSREAAPC